MLSEKAMVTRQARVASKQSFNAPALAKVFHLCSDTHDPVPPSVASETCSPLESLRGDRLEVRDAGRVVRGALG